MSALRAALGDYLELRRGLGFGLVRDGKLLCPVHGSVSRTLAGLTHVGTRECDPAVGTFITVDPIMDVSDDQLCAPYTAAVVPSAKLSPFAAPGARPREFLHPYPLTTLLPA